MFRRRNKTEDGDDSAADVVNTEYKKLGKMRYVSDFSHSLGLQSNFLIVWYYV